VAGAVSGMSDSDFLHAFESCTLTRAEWTHQSHVRMAWLYLSSQPLESALRKIRSGIQKLNQSHGNVIGYHETITLAYARLVAAAIAKSPEAAFSDFCAAHPELLDREAKVLLRHYRRETLRSPQARAEFVEPELEPLP
jgi:hypothetical protein